MSNARSSTVLLIDGHSLAYRAFYALPADMATSKGVVTNAAYGFTSMLVKVLSDEQPGHVAVAFDLPKPTFRNAMDSGYKANRSETPELFPPQLTLIRSVLDVMGIPVVECEGFEADDIIATLAEQAESAGHDVLIVTGDRDSYQLVSDPHVQVLYNKRGVSDYARYDEAGIAERTGVTPSQYTDYAALRGDPSDNLPGVPGVGEKTAATLINKYGDLEGIYEHLEELTPKQRENVAAARDRVFLNRDMSRLRRNVDLGVELDALARTELRRDEARRLFDELEFQSLWKRLLASTNEPEDDDTSELAPVDVVRGDTVERALEVLQACSNAGRVVAIAAAWEGDAGRSRLTGVALTSGEGSVAFLTGDVVGKPRVRSALDTVLGSGGPGFATHDAKALVRGLHPLRLEGLVDDTLLMAYLLDPAARRLELDDVARVHLGLMLPGAEVAQATLELTLGDDDTAASAGERLAQRAVAIHGLVPKLRDALGARRLIDVYERTELALVGVLARLEEAGVLLDCDYLAGVSKELGAEASTLVERIHAQAGHPFNVNSTPQLRTVLFDELGLTPVKRTKTGPSTDADSLQRLATEHPIVGDLLRYREVEKLRGTYVDALPALVGADGRLHATFNQAGTTTGRISSDHPNLQNVPIRSTTGAQVRSAFIAPDGHVLLSADYSQIELRVLAHLSGDPGLSDAFARGVDIHTVTAAKVFGVDESEVDVSQRRFAKAVNYGLAYGMEAHGLASRLDISSEEARAILDGYFQAFSEVRAFMDETVQRARRNGFTTTILGRRRAIPELVSDVFRVRQSGERMAQNAPVQGSAADIFKLAMIGVDRRLTADASEAVMVLTVHDELVLEVPTDELDAVESAVREAMVDAYELTVPLVVDTGSGRTWADVK